MMYPTQPRRSSDRGFTLVEMIVVTLLLLIAMLGLLAVFDASARINKSETGVADAQGAVRYGIYQMTKAIRMAGAGGLFVTQAVLNHKDPDLGNSITIPGGTSYNNVPANTTVTDQTGTAVVVRTGTDMIEIRGVILSPLLGFDQQTATGCSTGCTTSSDTISVLPVTGDLKIGQLVNDDSPLGSTLRPQFAAIDAYTNNVSPADPMYVIVTDGNTDLHVGCSDPNPQGVQRWPQPLYNIGVITSKTTLSTVATPRVFGTANFTTSRDLEIDEELPSLPAAGVLNPIVKPRRVGVLDVVIFFIAMLPTSGPGADPQGLHPYLAQGIRRGDHFEVTPLADDVEDLQIAYGVDSNGDNRITRNDGPVFPDPLNRDPNFSTEAGKDEWQPNAFGEAVFTDDKFQSQQPFVDGHAGVPPAVHCPRLHAVMLSLLSKAHDPDPTYRGPAASGYVLMDVPRTSGVPITAVTGGQYRRRVQTLRINLRNYSFQG